MTVIYTDDFSSLTNWTTSEATGTGGTRDLVGGQFRMVTTVTSGNTQRAILGAAQWNQTNGKATIFFTTQTATDLMVPQIILRSSGDWSTEVDSPTTGYKLLWVAGNLAIYERHAGTTTQVGTNVAKTLAASTTYGLTFQCLNSQISGRLWTGTEPGTWDIDQPNAAVAGPGQVQLALLGQAAIREVRWDNLSVDNLVAAGPATGPRPRLMRV